MIPLERTKAILITIKAEIEFSEGFKRYRGDSVIDMQLKKK
ncbi:hypothetical protein TSIB_0395 [Thermococcus sibiricus MM 739]|uniref:Uncharacterized protein n=1 Tax=Thermococcus sibiricus (strain DSM 12597 / MM 739) TaxID=604354 RepID=C6A1G6_THESM|nr:hypothetical protein TSIB_0395 [Thermococcus sibiricus MM 739]